MWDTLFRNLFQFQAVSVEQESAYLRITHLVQQLHVFAHLLGMAGILAGKLEINHHQAVALHGPVARSGHRRLLSG